MNKNNEIPKAYEPRQVEDEIYAAWQQSGFFRPENLPNLDKRQESFTISLPPPNVTGTLHMGHAVMLAVEDAMIRFARMRGKRALWLPGTDHAAIATQAKVEKVLMKEGYNDPKHDLGREAFLARVEKFAKESHDTIVNQMKKMGTSVDWSREAYTLDEARSRAVRTVFKMMYEDGLIYRGDRVINWCPRCKSTLSDDEVEYREEKTKFYYFKYGPVVIGTARPETKFLDKIIIVHPDDDRYKDMVGKEFDVDWIEGNVKAKMVADPAAEMDMGSGAMTITPAHSIVDFELAKKYGFEISKIIDEDGNFTEAAGSFAGKNARESRDAIVEILQKKGLVDHIDEDYVHNLSICYRCGAPVEPLPKIQWFIDVNKPFPFRASKHAPIEGIEEGEEVTLKKLMQHTVRTSQIKIIPDRFNKTYFHWIDNLRDWNISRQLWYGHRVPVWYRGEETHVGVEAPEGEGWQQDSDTLDTWFSSGLWTFSTLGWPDDTEDMRLYHPTTVLETGYDILFFWIARMILMTTYVLGEVPFRYTYLHGLVRDESGRKMSKSLDNIIDPLEMIGKYGADATRLSLVIGSTPGNDSKLSEGKIAGYRNFTNKLWNISRFVLMKVENVENVENVEAKTLADRWIIGRFGDVVKEVTEHMDKFELSAAGEKLRDFTWSEFADWYLEIAKVQDDENTDRILLYILERLIALWHPFMPFVTEEIWKLFGTGELMIVHDWPKAAEKPDGKTARDFDLIKSAVVTIRNLRAQYKVEPKNKADVIISSPDFELFKEQEALIRQLARVENLTAGPSLGKPEGAASAVIGTSSLYLPLSGLIDIRKEKARLEKELEKTRKYIAGLEARLENREFVSKAPENVVVSLKQKQAEAAGQAAALETQIATL